jgi:hypothetical protein
MALVVMREKHEAERMLNPLNTELNPICHFLALLGAHHILHVSRLRALFNMHSMNIKVISVCFDYL